MISREVSGERDDNGSDGKTAWDTLKEVPFLGSDPYKDVHDANKDIREAHRERIERRREENKKFAVDVEDRRDERARIQRVQEMIERDLNSRLSSVEDMYYSEGSEKRTISYGDKEIDVIDMKGAPYRMLLTALDFKDKDWQIGGVLAGKLLKDPSIWAKNKKVAEQDSSFGKERPESGGDVIFASYANSEANATTFVPGKVIYGFDHIRPGSVVKALEADGGTQNNIGQGETHIKEDQANFISGLENGTSEGYNELTLKRYDEYTGEPLKPSYIVAKNGSISEESLRHAGYWGVPIINIETSAYLEKAHEKGERIIESITDETDFIELEKKISELRKYSGFGDYRTGITDIGRYDETEPMRQNEKRIKTLEITKALQFVEASLTEMTKKIEDDTEHGIITSCSPDDYGIKSFWLTLTDEFGRLHTKSGISRGSGSKSIRDIQIRLTMKDAPLRKLNVDVWDGQRPHDDSYIPGEGADSSFYIRLEPVVLRYFDACRKNNELNNKQNAA